MSVTVNKAALARITKKLGGISNMQKSARRPMEKTLDLLRDELTTAPRKSPGAFSALATAAQRRAYWAKIGKNPNRHREGVGYVRQGQLRNSWTVEPVKRTARGVMGIIGTNVPYAIFVHASEAQQKFHRASKWLTEKTVWKKTARARNRIWRAGFKTY